MATSQNTRTESHDEAETASRYKKYRPKWHAPPMSIFWWVRKKAFVKFISRELTSIFVAGYAILLIVQMRALAHGEQAWEAMSRWLSTPFSIGLHLIILGCVLFHSITWFNLAPKAMVVKIGKWRIPDAAVLTGNYAAWIVLSVTVAWFILTAR